MTYGLRPISSLFLLFSLLLVSCSGLRLAISIPPVASGFIRDGSSARHLLLMCTNGAGNQRIARKQPAAPSTAQRPDGRLSRVFQRSPTDAPMSNPYEPSNSGRHMRPTRRAVRRYLLGSAAVFVFAITVGIPGFTLLNQEYGWRPTQSGIYDIEVNGQPISNSAAIRYSMGSCVASVIVATLLCGKSFLNWRENRRTASGSE